MCTQLYNADGEHTINKYRVTSHKATNIQTIFPAATYTVHTMP